MFLFATKIRMLHTYTSENPLSQHSCLWGFHHGILLSLIFIFWVLVSLSFISTFFLKQDILSLLFWHSEPFHSLSETLSTSAIPLVPSIAEDAGFCGCWLKKAMAFLSLFPPGSCQGLQMLVLVKWSLELPSKSVVQFFFIYKSKNSKEPRIPW